ncbi:hypothetical protein SDC9_172944 [bioreactor metagenome]|uniref:Uncharacterized protein n=1 Tax=bioreactor metagenome TaxID=1076179 RepID=A0A645GHR0_9ZZZZ
MDSGVPHLAGAGDEAVGRLQDLPEPRVARGGCSGGVAERTQDDDLAEFIAVVPEPTDRYGEERRLVLPCLVLAKDGIDAVVLASELLVAGLQVAEQVYLVADARQVAAILHQLVGREIGRA